MDDAWRHDGQLDHLTLEQRSNLADLHSLVPAEVSEQVLSEKQGIRTIRATYTSEPGEVRQFIRLRAMR